MTKLFVFLAGLSLALPRVGRGEDLVSYKYQDYREADGRIAVRTHGAFLSKDFGTETRLKFEGIIDSIAGATPTGQLPKAGTTAIPMANLTERRKAWSSELGRQFQAVNVAVGAANSRESDYVSTAWSLNTRTDFNQKNTILLAGYSGTTDRVKVLFQPDRARKRTTDLILGVTQLIDPDTSLQFNVTWGRASGYLSDQYKLVEKSLEVVPGVFLPINYLENRPARKDKWVGLVTINHAVGESNAAIEMTGRHYQDSFGVDADSVELTFFQHVLGDLFVVQPEMRYYRQTAADFYHYDLNKTSIVPTLGVPRADGPFYSSDYRLSALGTETLGLKVVCNPTPALRFDVALERYRMKGRDRVTPAGLYTRATIVTVGGRITW